MDTRRYDIDWLRVGATYLLFVFHVGKVFDVPPFYHIKNAELSLSLGWFTVYIHQWHMPLFFLLAGWSLHCSLNVRGPRALMGERVRRILAPFLFGCVTLCAGLGYVEHILMKDVEMGFFAFLPKFFTSLDYFTWGHLWFLIYLFTFTLIYLPLLRRLPDCRPSAVGNLNSVIIYAPLPFLILAQLVLRIWWGGYQNLYNDWGNFTYYSAFLWFGFLLARYPRLYDAVIRERKRAAIIAAASSAIFMFFRISPFDSDTARHLAYYVPGTVVGYTVIITLLGWAYHNLRFHNRALDYLAESALPVYILHQYAIVFPGWFIIQIDAGIPEKFALLLATSVAVTMLAYHFTVRPAGPLRFVFGMKPQIKPAEPQPAHDAQ